MSKVVFIEPRGIFNAYGYFKLPLLGPIYLGTILKRRGHEVKVITENYTPAYDERKDRLHPAILDADVVGISSMTSTVNRGYQIARAIRKQRPDVKLLMGGPHATFRPEEALEYVDTVITGEAEGQIVDVVEGNVSDRIVKGAPIDDLDALPVPDLSLLEKVDSKLRYVPISTSRGCPYDCTFCSVTKMFGRKYRFRSPEAIVDEIGYRIRSGYHKFFFYDDNFAANQEGTKVMLESLLRKGYRFTWSAETRVDVAKDNELLKLMSQAGCLCLFLGLESVSPETLLSYNKRQTLDDIQTSIKKVKANNMRVHGMFVLGSDEDDPQTVQQTVDFCHKFNLDTAQFSILFPIPGTRLYDILESEGRIFTKDWSLYDGTHVVFKPKKMKPLELQRLYLWAWKRFYSLGHNIKTFIAARYLLNRWRRLNGRFLGYLRNLGKAY